MLFFDRPSAEPCPVPTLQVLDALVEKTKICGLDFSRTVLFCAQHHLDTTASLYRAFLQLGVAGIWSTGKYYSTTPAVESAMQQLGIHVISYDIPKEAGKFHDTFCAALRRAWAMLLSAIERLEIDTILVLDDGARALELMPAHVHSSYNVAAVEQTQAGLYSEKLPMLNIPVVSVASCALKKQLEPPFIIESALRALQTTLTTVAPTRETVFAVVGYGAIGKAMVDYLVSQRYIVLVYDQDRTLLAHLPAAATRAASIEQIFTMAHYIFGCTGKDITESRVDKILHLVHHEQILISLSSEDREFGALLRKLLESSVIMPEALEDIRARTKVGGAITILGGGVPINFLLNFRKHWTENIVVPNITLTRSALFVAVIQAKLLACKMNLETEKTRFSQALMLHPQLQQWVFELWHHTAHDRMHPESLYEHFKDEQWIYEHSGGTPVELPEHFLAPLSVDALLPLPPLPSLRARL